MPYALSFIGSLVSANERCQVFCTVKIGAEQVKADTFLVPRYGVKGKFVRLESKIENKLFFAIQETLYREATRDEQRAYDAAIQVST